jgi:hypothetical protein
MDQEICWYLLAADYHLGPYTAPELVDRLRSEESLVGFALWREGDGQEYPCNSWSELKQVREFGHLLEGDNTVVDLPDIPLPPLPTANNSIAPPKILKPAAPTLPSGPETSPPKLDNVVPLPSGLPRINMDSSILPKRQEREQSIVSQLDLLAEQQQSEKEKEAKEKELKEREAKKKSKKKTSKKKKVAKRKNTAEKKVEEVKVIESTSTLALWISTFIKRGKQALMVLAAAGLVLLISFGVTEYFNYVDQNKWVERLLIFTDVQEKRAIEDWKSYTKLMDNRSRSNKRMAKVDSQIGKLLVDSEQEEMLLKQEQEARFAKVIAGSVRERLETYSTLEALLIRLEQMVKEVVLAKKSAKSDPKPAKSDPEPARSEPKPEKSAFSVVEYAKQYAEQMAPVLQHLILTNLSRYNKMDAKGKKSVKGRSFLHIVKYGKRIAAFAGELVNRLYLINQKGPKVRALFLRRLTKEFVIYRLESRKRIVHYEKMLERSKIRRKKAVKGGK